MGKRGRKGAKKPKIEYEREEEYEFVKDEAPLVKEGSSKRRNVSKASKSTAGTDF